MDRFRIRCTAENSPNARSNEDEERDGSSGYVHDLNRLMKDAARLVQTASESQKTAELAHHYMGEALRRTSEVLDGSRMLFQASCRFGNHLLNQKDQTGYRALLQRHPELRTSYGTLLGAINNTEDVLSHVKIQRDEIHPSGQFLSENGDEAARSLSVNEKKSHHKQLETVRNEEQMGGAFLTQRRRSPRHSPSSCVDGLSPLLSEEELNTIQPIAQSPRSKGSSRFTNKIVHRLQEGSDSDADGTDSPSP
ncbi:uncharacterized protein LOC142656053 [Rhinoderma darwinii]|uniref:uncharacterized protein LOC142656053 n=1 Tax=Rhinoderma darwinii TaxID=43563 RepID=UPI003F664195